MTTAQRFGLGLVALAAGCVLAGAITGHAALWQPAAVAGAVVLVWTLGQFPATLGYRYTGWILAAVTAAMIYPQAFLRWGDFDLRNKWLVLLVVQLVMFGMGTQMKLRDLAGVLRMPWGVAVAVACQFTVMPLAGFALTRVFSFPDEIAAGVILIGCCSSGLASNVMTYLAGGNLPLSITATAITTLLAPLMTPLWMKLLAGTLVEVKFLGMMVEIVKIVLVPIGAALLHDTLRHASATARRRVWIVTVIAALGLAGIGLSWTALEERLEAGALLGIELAGFLCAGVIAGVGYHALTRWFPRLDATMPVVSMAGIIYFTAITTAAGRNNLLLVGPLLFLAAVLHNAAGYTLGYWLSRAAGLDRASCRTIAFEVGLQNGGMASGIAGGMGKLATLGLAAAIFSPWMNLSGSVLANHWKRRPVE